jgi:hypothetical protein
MRLTKNAVNVGQIKRYHAAMLALHGHRIVAMVEGFWVDNSTGLLYEFLVPQPLDLEKFKDVTDEGLLLKEPGDKEAHRMVPYCDERMRYSGHLTISCRFE